VAAYEQPVPELPALAATPDALDAWLRQHLTKDITLDPPQPAERASALRFARGTVPRSHALHGNAYGMLRDITCSWTLEGLGIYIPTRSVGTSVSCPVSGCPVAFAPRSHALHLSLPTDFLF
jgi:hypothetical protein